MDPFRRILLLALLSTTVACSGGGGSIDFEVVRVSEPLEREWATSDGIVADDYLLTGVNDFAVDEAGNLYVLDEDRVKVFSPKGQPVRIIGRPGQGPGEFENIHEISISETGYMTVKGGGYGFTVHLFSPAYDFISRTDYRNAAPYGARFPRESHIPGRPEKIVSFDEAHRFYRLDVRQRTESFGGDEDYHLFYETPDSVQTIARYTWSNMVSGGGIGRSISFLGDLLHAPLAGRRVVYTHTGVDIRGGEGIEEYVLHLIDLESGARTSIQRRYTPVPVTQEDITEFKFPVEQLPEGRNREQFSEVNKAIDEALGVVPFKSSLCYLMADGDRIFAVTYSKEDTLHALTDVFDAVSGEYICTITIPMRDYELPAVTLIRGGRAFGTNDYWNSGEDPAVLSYRVNPAVYRR